MGGTSRAREIRVPVSSTARNRRADSLLTAASPTARITMEEIPIRAVREAAINVRTVQTRDASPNGWPESRQQQSSLEPCQAE